MATVTTWPATALSQLVSVRLVLLSPTFLRQSGCGSFFGPFSSLPTSKVSPFSNCPFEGGLDGGLGLDVMRSIVTSSSFLAEIGVLFCLVDMSLSQFQTRAHKVKVKLVVTVANMESRADMGIDLDCPSCLFTQDIPRTSSQHAGSGSTSNQTLSALISVSVVRC